MKLTGILLFFLLAAQCPVAAQDNETLRVAVIGGLDMSGVWPRLQEQIEQDLDISIETVAAAPKQRVVPAFRSGQADLLLMHGGDETFALEALGFGSALRTWGYNDFVFVGPADDPAQLASAESGSDAMLRLAASQQPLIYFRDVGSLQVVRRLMDTAGLDPADLHILLDDVDRPQNILEQAAREQAYVIVGHMPVAFGRMEANGVTIIYRGDPAMRRGYSVVTPGPAHPAAIAARQLARRVADYLVSEDGQRAVELAGQSRGEQWILPRSSAAALIEF